MCIFLDVAASFLKRVGCLFLQMSPIQQGLQDAHPYVRRTAVMGVLKVYHLDKSAVRNAGAQPNLGTCSPVAMCISQVYFSVPVVIEFMLTEYCCMTGMLEMLQDMMTRDKDAQIVANCMSVLQQVWFSSQTYMQMRPWCPTALLPMWNSV